MDTPLIDLKASFTAIWKETIRVLGGATHQPHNPLRYPVIGTRGTEEVPNLRTLVLRKVSSNPERLWFFTDSRAQKVNELQACDRFQWLFYHPKKKIQLKIESTATFHHEDEWAQQFWAEIPEKRYSEYNTHYAPGTDQENPQEVDYRDPMDDRYFLAVAGSLQSMEILALGSPHQRLKLYKPDRQDEVQGHWLVP